MKSCLSYRDCILALQLFCDSYVMDNWWQCKWYR